MAKAINLIGGLKGRIGNVVYATNKGKTIARVYQPVVANPNTYRQQVSRVRFSIAGQVSKAMLRFITAGYNNGFSGREFQQAVKVMIASGNAIINVTNPDEYDVVYSNLAEALSLSQMPQFATFGAPDFETEGKVVFHIENVDEEGIIAEVGSLKNMGVVAMAYCPNLKQAVVESTDLFTSRSEMTVNLPAMWSGLSVSVYAMFKVIPTSKNGVVSTRLPWMYPSKTSVTAFIGTGDAA